MKSKIIPDIIILFFLVFLGSIALSFYARWLISAISPSNFEFFGYSFLLIIVVLAYCFCATAIFVRIHRGFIVSPIVVWIYIWLINVISYFYLSLDVSSIGSTFMMMIVTLGIVYHIGIVQQSILSRVFGFVGGEENCYIKSFVSTDSLTEIGAIFSQNDWLLNVFALRMKKHSEPSQLKMKIFSATRKFNLFALIEETNRTCVSFVAYVKKATIFENSIYSPTWCKLLVDNVISMIKQKGIDLEGQDNRQQKKDILDYALREVKPFLSKEKLEKISIPLFVLIVVIIAFSMAHFLVRIEPSLNVAIVTLIFSMIIFLIEYRRRQLPR